MRDTREPLYASDLDDLVTILAPAGTLASTEQTVETGVPAGIWALPIQFQSREQMGLGGLQTTTTYMVSVRYRTDIRPDYVLVEEGGLERRFQIIARVPSERGDALDMTCVTV